MTQALLSYPGKFHLAARYFDHYIGDLETTALLDNEHKLMFYALRRLVEDGPCTDPAPPLWRFTERHKHQAWSRISGMSKYEAMVHFVSQFELILGSPVDWEERAKEMGEDGIGNTQLGTVEDVEPQTPADLTPAAPTTTSSNVAVPPAVLATFDADIQSHTAPTAENIMYLATALMQARHALAQHATTITTTMPATPPTPTTTPNHDDHQEVQRILKAMSTAQPEQHHGAHPHSITSPPMRTPFYAISSPPLKQTYGPFPTPEAMATAAVHMTRRGPPIPQSPAQMSWVQWMGFT